MQFRFNIYIQKLYFTTKLILSLLKGAPGSPGKPGPAGVGARGPAGPTGEPGPTVS